VELRKTPARLPPAMLGAAETVIGLTEAFKPLADKRGLYVLNSQHSTRGAENVIRLAAAKA
jgi:chemotaxis protein methyltransferase CheR